MKDTKKAKNQGRAEPTFDEIEARMRETMPQARYDILRRHMLKGFELGVEYLAQVEAYNMWKDGNRERCARQESAYDQCMDISEDFPPCFSMNASDYYLKTVLDYIKNEGWLKERVRQKDWIYRMTGRWTGRGMPSEKRIMLGSINQCRLIVKEIIFRGKRVSEANWKKVRQVFDALEGSMENVQNANKAPYVSADFEQFLRNTLPDQQPAEL